MDLLGRVTMSTPLCEHPTEPVSSSLPVVAQAHCIHTRLSHIQPTPAVRHHVHTIPPHGLLHGTPASTLHPREHHSNEQHSRDIGFSCQHQEHLEREATMDVFEYTDDDSDDDLAFLSGAGQPARRLSGGERKQEVAKLHADTKSLLQSLQQTPSRGRYTPSKDRSKGTKSDPPGSRTQTPSKRRKDAASSTTPTPLKKFRAVASTTPSSHKTKQPSRITSDVASERPSSELPLYAPASAPKAATMLVQLEDPTIDLSGDTGAIGRFHTQGDGAVILDIKGQQYAGEIVPCTTFMVVGVGPSEARVECVMNEFCQITHKKDLLTALDGVVTAGCLDSGTEGDGSPSRPGSQ